MYLEGGDDGFEFSKPHTMQNSMSKTLDKIEETQMEDVPSSALAQIFANDIDMIKDLKYNGCMLKSVSILVFFLNWAINLDHGAVPAAIQAIMKDIKIQEV